jgi:drug/metabolite transporter (DMT)-like permease
MMTAAVPGLAALSAVLLLDEPMGWNLALGLVLVTTGIVFGVRTAPPAPAPAIVAVPLPRSGH